MGDFKRIFERNRLWAEKIKEINPEYFSALSEQQTPEFFWIGCSDSRVPANQILDLPPGEVFVHRNIANVVVPSDLNCLSVLQYAVEVLEVKHILVCGHYGCGGVLASIDGEDHGLIDNWLQHIRYVYRLHKDELDAIEDTSERADRLCELNVVEQTRNICNTTIVKNRWKAGKEIAVHGVVYSLKNGILNEMMSQKSLTE